MAKEYDTSGKSLIRINPVDWLHLAGIPATAVEIANVNLTTVQKDEEYGE